MNIINILTYLTIGFGIGIYSPIALYTTKINKKFKQYEERFEYLVALRKVVYSLKDTNQSNVEIMNKNMEVFNTRLNNVEKKLETVKVNKAVRVVIEEEK